MPRASTQRIAIALIGLLGSAVFVALAFRRLDGQAVLATWRGAHLLPWIPLAAVAYLAGHFVRGQRLRILMQGDSQLSLATATNIVVVGYASNNVFPARLGEFVRAGMLAERTGVPIAQALTVTFIERLLDGIAILLLLLAGTAMLPVRPEWIWNIARVGSLVFGVALAVVFVAVFLPNLVLSTASRVSARLGNKGRDRVIFLASSITSAGAVLRRPRGAVVIAAYSVVVWLLEASMFAFILPVFSLQLSAAPALVAMSVTNLGILVPSSPGFVGPFHFFCSQALASQGVPDATAMGYAVIVHLTFYIPVTLWGAGAILWYGVQVGATAALARAARQSPQGKTVGGVPVHVVARVESKAAAGPPSEFDVALSKAILTPPGGAIDEASLQHVAAFLSEAMAALPPRLRFLYEAGMTVFRLSVRLRYLQSFCRLDTDRQRAAMQAWAFGRIGLFRQLFRPVRSLALLAYFERDAVVKALAPVPVTTLALEPHG